jgi:hypothetical protein
MDERVVGLGSASGDFGEGVRLVKQRGQRLHSLLSLKIDISIERFFRLQEFFESIVERFCLSGGALAWVTR